MEMLSLEVQNIAQSI